MDRVEPPVDQNKVLFQSQEYVHFDENRVLREIALDYDDDTSEIVSSAREFSTEDLAELQARRIQETYGEFQLYHDPQSEVLEA